jgi:hypothetical protein
MKDTYQRKNITLKSRQVKWLTDNSKNLSRYVQSKIDADMKRKH